ncbi:MAG: aconitase X, partial [Desulfobacteraceae bacterium]|nr:aconitase X [Desulfobacteraceae bacterium]
MISLETEQKKMLEGSRGPGVKKAMEILYAYGQCYNARRMIPVTSVHVAGNFPVLMDEGIEWLEKLAEDGARVSVFTTKNPEMFDLERAEALNVP